jgi:hypothetical protein
VTDYNNKSNLIRIKVKIKTYFQSKLKSRA